MGVLFIFNKKKISKEDLLSKKDLPYTIMMVVLDIIAPILLMYGLKECTAENASLLNNFEIVITSLVALIIFKEAISYKTWIGIVLITISTFLLTIKDISKFSFSLGSVFILLATLCWGIENNCTKKISNKSSYQIVTIKGIFSGSITLLIGFVFLKESITNYWYILFAILLGFVSYGLSIFLYVKAQSVLGASKTSAFYAINPFIASILSLIIFKTNLQWNFYVALLVMLLGSFLIVFDTLKKKKEEAS